MVSYAKFKEKTLMVLMVETLVFIIIIPKPLKIFDLWTKNIIFLNHCIRDYNIDENKNYQLLQSLRAVLTDFE